MRNKLGSMPPGCRPCAKSPVNCCGQHGEGKGRLGSVKRNSAPQRTCIIICGAEEDSLHQHPFDWRGDQPLLPPELALFPANRSGFGGDRRYAEDDEVEQRQQRRDDSPMIPNERHVILSLLPNTPAGCIDGLVGGCGAKSYRKVCEKHVSATRISGQRAVPVSVKQQICSNHDIKAAANTLMTCDWLAFR